MDHRSRADEEGTAHPAKVVVALGALYAAQGITGSIVQTGLPTVLREGGVRLDLLGFLYLLFLPWALKFLWAPYVDRYSLARFGHRRFWIMVCQLSLIACFALLALVTPTVDVVWLCVLLALIAMFASTQDISTDALAVEALPKRRRYLGGSIQVAGSYAGFVVGVGLWLPIYAWAGWSVAVLVTAGFLAFCAAPVWLMRRLDRDIPAEARARTGLLRSLRRRRVRQSAYFILVYQLGTRLGIALIGPFLVDAAMPLPTIGWLKGIAGAAAGLAGAILGGWVLRRIGERAALGLFAFAHAIGFAALAVLAVADVKDTVVLAIVVLAGGVALSLCFVALYTSMIGWCTPGEAGTDFAILQSADAILAIAAAVVAGIISERFGHGVNFSIAALLLVVGGLVALRYTPRPLSAAAAGLPEADAGDQTA